MNDRILHNLGLGRKLVLTIAATLAIAIPVTVGLLTAPPGRAQSQAATSNLQSPAYTSVSIKPSGLPEGQPQKMLVNSADGSFTARGATLRRLIQLAYHVQDSQIVPDLTDRIFTAKLDIDATVDPSVAAASFKQIAESHSGALKVLLAEQFKLVVHFENQFHPAYDLVVDSGGPKLQQNDASHIFHLEPGQLTSQGTPLDLLAAQLSVRVGRAVIDKTGLKGNYAFNLHWTPDAAELERIRRADEVYPAKSAIDPNGPSLFTALQEQLGLKLEPHEEPVPVLVIEHAESPAGLL